MRFRRAVGVGLRLSGLGLGTWVCGRGFWRTVFMVAFLRGGLGVVV